MTIDASDPVALLSQLVKCPSITPEEGGALVQLRDVLESIGFECTRLPFSEDNTPDVDNLFARLGTGSPHFCFAGHTDVVPPGNEDDWSHPPFSAAIEGGFLYGRGASDMKGGIACFIAALKRFLDAKPGSFEGSISLLITGDEEGPALNGTVKVLKWMAENNHTPDHCIVGEPTSVSTVGDMIKIGRRGSINGHLIVEGIQGHVAYPQKAKNPFDLMVRILGRLNSETLDSGNQHFQPSNLEITAIDTNNPASNVIPAKTEAQFNIRYNDTYNSNSIAAHITAICHKVAGEQSGDIQLSFQASGDSFLTEPDAFVDDVCASITAKTGVAPEMSTGGGTSDARFITNYCPVIEFGAIAENIHGIDERANIKNLEIVTGIYQDVLGRYFS
jgi:succinyl-diaminopimelate desuccinylase